MVEKSIKEETKNKLENLEGKKIIKSGLEIHQQLDTGKLFCRCPSILRQDKADWIVKRKLHAVAGESGQVDVAAKHETEIDREFIYEGYKDSCCLVEFDEQPPLEIDKEALKIAVRVALLLNCEILPYTQIMRKTVLNGSNTSGFQRTLIIAKDGFIETSFGRVGIQSICLEEDAAREISRDSHSVTFRLDRLGIPLIEIATNPDIFLAEQIKETALKIGEILRACKVKRGLGTIRQDINISSKGHPRVEIKGFQEPLMMQKAGELEYERQQKILEIHEKVKKLKLIKPEIKDLTKIFEKTESKLVKNVLDKKGKVFGIKVQGFAGIFGIEFYENRRFGSEVSDYAKLHGVGGIIHSDEKLEEKYHFSENEIEKVKNELGVKDKDAFIMVVSEFENKARKALEACVNRINIQIENSGIGEVRKGDNETGATSFMRPMPGADRLYPETDLPLLHISRDFINETKKDMPKLKTEISQELKTRGLSGEMIALLLDSGKLNEFETLLKIYNNPNFVAKLLLILPKEIASHEKVREDIFNLDILESVLQNITSKKISEGDSKHVLESIAQGKTLEDSLKIEKVEVSDIESEIAKIVKEKPGLNANAYMGLVMSNFKGKISGKEVMDILKRLGK
jgi:glutamyl-tRNA(Gln) amidotransferase subunit E